MFYVVDFCIYVGIILNLYVTNDSLNDNYVWVFPDFGPPQGYAPPRPCWIDLP